MRINPHFCRVSSRKNTAGAHWTGHRVESTIPAGKRSLIVKLQADILLSCTNSHSLQGFEMFVWSLNEATDLFPSIYEHSVYNSSRWSQKRLYAGESIRLSYGFLHFYFRRTLHISSHSTAFCILVLVRCSCLLSLDRLAHDIGWRMAPILWCTWRLKRVKKIPPIIFHLG